MMEMKIRYRAVRRSRNLPYYEQVRPICLLLLRMHELETAATLTECMSSKEQNYFYAPERPFMHITF